MSQLAISYKRHRFPPPIIAHAVWLYFRFPLSLRMVEEMLLERGIVVSYETIRCWGQRFGSDYVRRLRRKQPSSNDVWHLDAVVITVSGRKHWLWRAVDQDGYVLDETPEYQGRQAPIDTAVEETGHATQAHYSRQVSLLWSSPRQVMPNVEHRSHKGLNNQAKNSHIPLRKRERSMQGFRSTGGCSDLSRSFLPCATFSFRPATNVPPSASTFIGSAPWRNGKP